MDRVRPGEDGQLALRPRLERAACRIRRPRSLWASTSPLLADKGGLYREDCDVVPIATERSPRTLHGAPWAVDDEAAERLWTTSQDLLAKA